MHREDLAEHHLDARLLPELAPRRIAHVLVVFDVPAGDAPLPAVRSAGAPPEEHAPPVVEQDHRDPDRGVLQKTNEHSGQTSRSRPWRERRPSPAPHFGQNENSRGISRTPRSRRRP